MNQICTYRFQSMYLSIIYNGLKLRQRTERLEQAGGPAGLTLVLASN